MFTKYWPILESPLDAKRGDNHCLCNGLYLLDKLFDLINLLIEDDMPTISRTTDWSCVPKKNLEILNCDTCSMYPMNWKLKENYIKGNWCLLPGESKDSHLCLFCRATKRLCCSSLVCRSATSFSSLRPSSSNILIIVYLSL